MTVQPLGKEFYTCLLNLEEELIQNCSKDIVNKLITAYAKCVEYFDRANNPVSFYFSEKILHTLSRQVTIPDNAEHTQGDV